MTFLSWVVLGGIAGVIAGIVVREGQFTFHDMLLGIVGAVDAGYLFQLLAKPATLQLRVASAVAAALGAALVLSSYHALMRRRTQP